MPTANSPPNPTIAPKWAPPLEEPTLVQYFTQLISYEVEVVWHNARAQCLQEGGDLATILTEAESQALRYLEATNDALGDPCYGILKYRGVEYKCGTFANVLRFLCLCRDSHITFVSLSKHAFRTQRF